MHRRLAHCAYIGRHSPKAVLVSAFTAWMFIGMVLEALLWALLCLYHPALTSLQNLETALYFSEEVPGLCSEWKPWKYYG